MVLNEFSIPFFIKGINMCNINEEEVEEGVLTAYEMVKVQVIFCVSSDVELQ